MISEASRRRRLHKHRLRHLRNAAVACAIVAAVAVAVWAVLRVDTPSPDDQLGPLPGPMPAAVATTPPTAPTSSPGPAANTPLVRLAVLGDAGTREAMQAKVAAQIAAADRQGRPFGALLITGDLIYEEGEADLTEASVVRPYASTFTKTEIIAAIGNHDIESDESDEIMQHLGRPGPVYVQDVGPVRVISLDSNNVSSAQTEWLSSVLDQPRPANSWVIVILHHPPFSSGRHGSEESVRRAWVPLFARHGVNLVLAGHDHSYERTKPQSGVTYIVSGGGGKELYDVGRSSFTATSAKKHHFVDLTVFAREIQGRAIDSNGQVFDTFVIPLEDSAN
ncbi:MAG TPA: metallophosphoesterase [Aeromicrobium sp.]|nr:metallophosphoesterase [Aeromicrobium sp.]